MVARREGATAAAAVAALAALGGSYLAVRRGTAEVVDGPARVALGRPLGARADVAVGALTDLGSVYGLGGTAAALAATGRPRLAVELLAAGGTAWCAAQAAKPALRRPRPYETATAARLVAVPAGSSWPSGHAAVATATATTLWPRLHPAARPAVVATVAAVGASRIYVGVHHLTDVVAGAGVGVLSALLTREVARAAGLGDGDASRGATDDAGVS